MKCRISAKLLLPLMILCIGFIAHGQPTNQKTITYSDTLNFIDACQYGDIVKVREFLEKGVDVNVKDNNGRTSILTATDAGNVEIAELLVEKGANVNEIEEGSQCTPLNYAARQGNAKLCELFIEHGAKLVICCYPGCGNGRQRAFNEISAFDDASENKHPELFPILFKAISNMKDSDQINWLIETSARNGNKDVCGFFFSKGINVDVRIRSGKTLLFFAVCGNGVMSDNDRKRLDTVAFLISKGADVNARDSEGMTPLHEAAECGNKELCKLLLSKGADINSKSEDGDTPLMDAIFPVEDYYEWKSVISPELEAEAIDTMEYLILKGADVNSKGKNGYTILHSAASLGSKEICRFLVSKGADINAIYEKDETPLKLAVQSSNKEVADYLRSVGAKE